MSRDKKLTSFVILANPHPAEGSARTWNELDKGFIKNIVTGKSGEGSENIDRNRLVSGVPTPFARAEMFAKALRWNSASASGKEGVLVEFFTELVGEWKGLIGLFALHGSDIATERIFLVNPGDDRLLNPALNLYDMRGSLGRMLFRAGPMWKGPNPNRPGLEDPFIDVIRFRGRVIGGTSPRVLVFTGVDRGLPEDTPFINPKTGLLDDPLKWAGLRREDKIALHHFVENMKDNFKAYLDSYTQRGVSLDYVDIPGVLEKWLKEIKSSLGAGVDYERSLKPTFTKMESPFDIVFNIEQKLWGANGKLALTNDGLGLSRDQKGIEFSPQQLLADPERSTIVGISVNEDEVSSLGVHLLRVDAPGGPRFFSLPLSAMGLAVFENSLGSLLPSAQDAGRDASRLRATYDEVAQTLKARLELELGNGVRAIAEAEYRGVALLDGGPRVICWPDFVDKDWQEYYLYSELPHNGYGVQAFPLRGDAEARRLMQTESDGAVFSGFSVAYRNGDAVSGSGAGEWRPEKPDSIELLIGVNQSKLNDSDFLYEVYKSKRPFKGLQFRKLQQDAGYILFHEPAYPKTDDQGRPSKLPTLQRLSDETPSRARVGIDFGSNNTCVSFFVKDADMETPDLVRFKNRRRFLLGFENESGANQQVTPGEGFFFSNEELAGNELKSMVTIHDPRRLMMWDGATSEQQRNVLLAKAVIGGIPFFERNVPVEKSTKTRHHVRFGGQEAQILHSMKWSQDEVERAHQTAFLRTLWLKVWAELFAEEKCRPAELVWAVPSAMSQTMQVRYRNMWLDVAEEPPVARYGSVQVADEPAGQRLVQSSTDEDTFDPDAEASESTSSRVTGLRAYTESSAVSRYAAYCRPKDDRISLVTDTYHIGLDVGGSTTDFLCLVSRKIPGEANHKKTLIKEGSIRLAAGTLAAATERASGFTDALLSFCHSSDNFKKVPGLTAKGPLLLTPSTAPYYFNLILDRMKEEEFRKFYNELRTHCPELFILNAFVTGFIQFHAGQLAYRVHLLRQDLVSQFGSDPVRSVSISPYGKGGRIFDWLPKTVGEASKTYYRKAFRTGFGLPAVKPEDPEANANAKVLAAITPEPEFKDSQLKDAKREVSFGLAYTGVDDIITTSDKLRDMVGERGYSYQGQALDEWRDITPAQLEHIGGDLKVPSTFDRLGSFLQVFEQFVNSNFEKHRLNTTDLMKKMQLAPFVENDGEFRRAKNEAEKEPGKSFDFHAPLIVLEAMCFLKVLEQELFEKKR